jgi:hypothetical protein
MSTELTPEQRIEIVITAGRAIVRMIEAADILLARDPVWTDLAGSA